MDNEAQHFGVMGMHWGNTNDEHLEHYGKPGMKWGHRSKVWAKDRVFGSVKFVKNAVTHPILTTVAEVKTIPRHKVSTVAALATGGQLMSNRQIKDINTTTNAMVAAKKAKKIAKAQAHAASILTKHGGKKVSAL
jgi:hypothetical protein